MSLKDSSNDSSKVSDRAPPKRSLVKNAGAMGVAVLLSRFLGLIREQVFAYLFGAGFYSDASLVAYRIPNLLRDLLAEGALSSSFVSVFSKEKVLADKQALYKRVSHLLLWVLLFFTVAIFIFSEDIVSLMAGGFRDIPGKFELTVSLTRILSPFLLFTSLGALSMGLLNSLGLYFLPSLGAAAFNLANIFIGGLGAYLLLRNGYSLTEATVMFAIGTLAGGFFSWAIQWRAQTQKSFPPLGGLRGFLNPMQLKAAFRDKRIQRMFAMIAPAVLTVGVLQVNIFVNTGLAADLAEGSVTWLNYAYRLLHFPMGIFGVSLFMATLPKLSELVSDKKSFEATLQEAMGLSLFVSVGAAVGLCVFAEPLMAMLFEHGRFTSLDVSRSALALQAYSIGLLAFNLNKILISAFFALEEVWTPALLSLVSIVANYFFSVYLSRQFEHAGIALSVSLTSLMTTLSLIVFLRQKKIAVPLIWLLRVLLGSLLCVVPMLLFYYFGGTGFLWALKYQSTALGILGVLATVGFFGAAYLALSVLFLREGRSFYHKILRPRLRRFF